MPRSASTRHLAAAAATITLAVAGCSAPVHVEAAPYAAAPACSALMLDLPMRLSGMQKRGTDSEATAAWGEPEPVILRCGVEPSPATPDHCVTVISADGTSTDWLSVADPDGSGDWLLTSYGRRPAVEVRVPASAATTATRPTDLLVDLGQALKRATLERTCS